MADWFAQHWIEVFGFVSGLVCVYLSARRNIWTYPVGIASSLVYFALFIQYALYADAGLQLVFVVLSITGWVAWARSTAVDERTATRSITPRAAIPVIIAAIGIGAALALILGAFTDSTTEVADAGTTALSLVAQFMMNRRWIESWYVWITADVLYIGLYLYKGLWITAVLYLVFIVVCILGLGTWRRAPHEVVQRNPEEVRV